MFPKFVLLLQGFVSESAWVRIVIRNWIRIQVKIQEHSRLKMDPWRAVDAQNGAVEAQYKGSVGQ
jgi:hypothetical protein